MEYILGLLYNATNCEDYHVCMESSVGFDQVFNFELLYNIYLMYDFLNFLSRFLFWSGSAFLSVFFSPLYFAVFIWPKLIIAYRNKKVTICGTWGRKWGKTNQLCLDWLAQLLNSFPFCLNFQGQSNRWYNTKIPPMSVKYTLHFWCLNSALVFSDIKNSARSVILTSGTLAPMDSFQSELGTQFPIKLEANHVIDKEQVREVLNIYLFTWIDG